MAMTEDDGNLARWELKCGRVKPVSKYYTLLTEITIFTWTIQKHGQCIKNKTKLGDTRLKGSIKIIIYTMALEIQDSRIPLN